MLSAEKQKACGLKTFQPAPGTILSGPTWRVDKKLEPHWLEAGTSHGTACKPKQFSLYLVEVAGRP